MLHLTRALLLAAVAAVSVSRSAAAAKDPAAKLDPADRRAFLEYEAQLRQLLADPARGSTAAATPPGATCALYRPEAARMTGQECLACHGLHRSHPIDLDYESARAKPDSDLRPAAEVVRRGVFLPEGQVRCVTCHDARSPWAARLALPAGTPVRQAVDPRNRATYEQPERAGAAVVTPGGAASPTPLCKACHTIGE